MVWGALAGGINATGRLLRRVGVRSVGFDADDLIQEARDRSGLEDFGDDAFRRPFRRLVDAYSRAEHLTLLGRLSARSDLLRLLTNRLRLVEDRRRTPEIADERVRRPWLIAGLPRTGTTLLHGLLTQDPRNRSPETWAVMYPSPPPGLRPREDERRVDRVRRELGWFRRLNPEYRVAHPLGAGLPQECMAVTTHAFESPRFHRTHYLPEYRAWIGDRDGEQAYRFHRRILQHLQWGTGGERWVLKNPPHCFWIETVDRLYPEARYVQTHREPLTVLASMASHNQRLRRVFAGGIAPDPDVLARRWAGAMETMMDFRDRSDVPDDRFVDVHFSDLLGSPIGEVRRIYRRFGLSLPAEVERRMRDYLRRHPRDEHGVHRYTAAEFGVEESRHGPLFDRYRERFGVERTPEDRRKLGAPGAEP